MQSQLVTASILEVGWLASGCVPALKKKKTRRRRFPKSFGDYRVNPSSCHRSASYRRSLALSSSEHIVRREAKVQLAMAEWMSLSMVVYCLFGLIISGGNSAKVASPQWAHQLADQALKTDRMRRSQSHFVSR